MLLSKITSPVVPAAVVAAGSLSPENPGATVAVGFAGLAPNRLEDGNADILFLDSQ